MQSGTHRHLSGTNTENVAFCPYLPSFSGKLQRNIEVQGLFCLLNAPKWIFLGLVFQSEISEGLASDEKLRGCPKLVIKLNNILMKYFIKLKLIQNIMLQLILLIFPFASASPVAWHRTVIDPGRQLRVSLEMIGKNAESKDI